MKESEQYCPICKRVIIVCNKKEVESGKHAGYVFVHDDIIHTDDDLRALSVGIQ